MSKKPRTGLTKEQVNKLYRGVYVEFTSSYDYKTRTYTYDIHGVSKTIRENTTLGESVGTPREYCDDISGV